MICTITFNPSLDLTGTVDNLTANEKSYVRNELYAPGGNGINAGIIASRLGGSVLFTGFLGGSNGKKISDLLLGMKLKLGFINIKNETRMNITIGNEHTHKQTRLSFTGPKISKLDWQKMVRVLDQLEPANDIVVLGGSLPPGVSSGSIRTLIRSLKRRGMFCMVDMPAKHLQEIIKAKPDFIKPNLEEFHELTNSHGNSIKDVRKEILELQKFIPLICVSSVEGGALLVGRNEIWYGKTPKIKERTSVGAGDSMVGAMAYALSKNRNVELHELLRLGLSASSATLTEPGLTLGTKKSILEFYKKVVVKRLLF